jgi:hypothetical protein
LALAGRRDETRPIVVVVVVVVVRRRRRRRVVVVVGTMPVPWRATTRRGDAEETSTSGRDAREETLVEDLVPLEHFSRVIRGRARETGRETCALGARGVKGKGTAREEDAREWSMTRRRRARTRDALGRDVRLKGANRARDDVVAMCGTFDALRLAGTSASASAAKSVASTTATDPLAARYLSVPLGRADVDVVVRRWGFRTLRDLGTALAMERQVFGARDEAERARTRRETAAGPRDDATKSVEDVVRSMTSALRAMRAVSRARRFPLAAPRGTPARARAARAALKEDARRVDETARRVGWKINDYRRRKQMDGRILTDAPRESDAREREAREVKATPGDAPSRALKRAASNATTSASKRARHDARKPLVLKLREPKISILGSRFLSDAFGRDITNATSEKTRDAVRSVSKAAAGVIRRNLFGRVHRMDPATSTPRDDVILRPFPKLPR